MWNPFSNRSSAIRLLIVFNIFSGWGIFNPWTCRCDCPVGICLDNNQQCYTPCTDTINTNPFAGCSPGWDCPWFPDTNAGYCKSELHQPNNFEIYRTAKECCDEHFGGSAACMNNAKTVGKGHAPFPWPIHFPGTPEYREFRPLEAEHHWGTEAGNGVAWFPDLHNKRNCVWGNNYENWMSEDGFGDWYLFNSSATCCEAWYPGQSGKSLMNWQKIHSIALILTFDSRLPRYRESSQSGSRR